MNLRNMLSRIFAGAKSPAFLALIAAAFLFPSMAQAQFRASLRGTITDPNGGAIVGATVTLTNTSTNETLTSTTDANGIYQFNALAPAPYRLSVEKSGFETKTLEHVQIIPEQPNGLDVQLAVGTVQQSVTVTGTTYALNTENATISGTVTRNEIQNMPSFGRDVTKLAALAPGVFGNEAQGRGAVPPIYPALKQVVEQPAALMASSRPKTACRSSQTEVKPKTTASRSMGSAPQALCGAGPRSSPLLKAQSKACR